MKLSWDGAYDRKALQPGWVHLGNGQFFRAHQAVYQDELLRKEGKGWGIAAVSLQTPDARDALRAEDNLYTVNGSVVGSINESLFLKDDEARIRELLWDASLVTLTLTEKAYRENEPAIVFLRDALRGRKKPLTLLSCDNLQENSRVLQRVLGVDAHYPCSMVDRIVPHSADPCAIRTETFKQWVIENDFAGPRPAWEKVGVEFVEDVRPFEKMKLQVLNASHSWIAYTGLLAGFTTVDQAVGPEVERLMRKELAPSVAIDYDLEKYCRDLLARFRNPALGHRLEQIAMDGTQKIPQRWLPVLQKGRTPLLLEGLASWALYISLLLWVKGQKPKDPRADEIAALWPKAGATSEALGQATAKLGLLPGDLLQKEEWRAAILRRLPPELKGKVL